MTDTPSFVDLARRWAPVGAQLVGVAVIAVGFAMLAAWIGVVVAGVGMVTFGTLAELALNESTQPGKDADQ